MRETRPGITYAGAAREDVMEIPIPVIEQSEGGAQNMLGYPFAVVLPWVKRHERTKTPTTSLSR
jgi:hypothetical protein